MEFYNRTTPKARKEYRCEYCNGPIHIGERHSHETGKYDGEIFSRRLHFPCYNMIYACIRDTGEYEFDYDMVDDWLSDRYCCDCKDEEECDHIQSKCPNILKDFQEEGAE